MSCYNVILSIKVKLYKLNIFVKVFLAEVYFLSEFALRSKSKYSETLLTTS